MKRSTRTTDSDANFKVQNPLKDSSQLFREEFGVSDGEKCEEYYLYTQTEKILLQKMIKYWLIRKNRIWTNIIVQG